MWDLTANACSCELVPEVGTAIRSITVAGDSSLVIAANHAGTCYVWRMQRGAGLTTHFEPHHKLKAHPGESCVCVCVCGAGLTTHFEPHHKLKAPR